jgi:apolipoprotein N-acyltransferase
MCRGCFSCGEPLARGSLVDGGVFLLPDQSKSRRIRTKKFLFGIGLWHGDLFVALAILHKHFSGAALILWLVLALWVGLFMMLASHYQRRRSVPLQCVMLTCAWMALEYFRGELCFLKFTWATPSLAFKGLHGTSLLGALGVYGVSGLCVSLAAVALLFPHKYQILWILLATVGLDLVRHLIERNRKTTT